MFTVRALTAMCLALALSVWARADSIPTDEQIIRDVRGKGKGVIDVKLSDKSGKKVWSSAYKQYFWEKVVVVKREAKLDGLPDAKVLVGGFARYEITGGQYSYREFKVAWNEYEGIPRPTDDDAVKIVKSKLAEFLRGPASNMVHGDKIAIEIAKGDEQKWVWHSPESVSFNVRIKYVQVVSSTEIVTVNAIWEARLYRDKVNQPWQRITGSERQRTEGNRQKLSVQALKALPRGVPE